MCPKLSFKGLVLVLPSDLALAKAGDSCMLLRIIYDTTTIRMDTQNGMRQPQSSKASLDMAPLVNKITIKDTNKPTVAVVWIHEVQ